MSKYLNSVNKAFGLQEGVSSLLNDEFFPSVSRYMRDRHGMTEEDNTREEIRDAFVNSMRSFNAGNSITATQEMNYLYRGEGAELTERRETAASAYDLWDSLKGSFDGTTVGEKADAVGDYAKALILDPVNVVSFGFGKLAGVGATKAATQALKVLAREAATTAATAATRRGVTGAALQQVRREAAQGVMSRGMREASYQTALKKGGVRDIVVSGLTDVAAGVLVDAGSQQANILTGRQEEYDPVRGAIVGIVGGVVVGGIAGASVALRGSTNLENTSTAIARDRETIAQALARYTNEETGASAAAREVDPLRASQKLGEWLTPFQEYVEQGRFLREADDPAWELYEETLNQAFVQGVKDILDASGIPIERLNPALGQRRSGWLVNVVTDPSFPNKTFDELQDFLDDTVGKLQGRSVPIEDYLLINAERASEAGRTLRAQRMTADAARLLGRRPGDITGREALDSALGDVPGPRGKIADWISSGQNTFIRMLVTHPGTTALNLTGWAQATSTQTYSDLLRGALYGGTAAITGLVGQGATSAKYAKMARSMVALQGQKIRNLADPLGTRDEVLDYLTYRPEAQDTLFRYLAGGVEAEDVMKELNLLPGETISKTGFQKAFDGLQVAYGVSAQDMLTKTQEFAYAIDKQIRLKYGMSFNDFMKQENISDILTNPKTTSFKDYALIEGRAVEDALGNVFAKKYGPRPGDRAGPLKFVAGVIEEARNIPIIGAMVPFGQFFNNTLGFMFDHTFISLIHKIATGSARDPLDLVTKSAVGWGLIGWAASKEMSNLEEGLAWHEERNDKGAVVTRLYDYPLSFWKMVGRIAAHARRDQEVPVDLMVEFGKTFGIESVSRQLGDAAGYVVNGITMLGAGETEQARKSAIDAVKASLAMYVSGFTRFVDPINTALAFAEGDNYIEPTRNIGNKSLNNAIRYTDQVIDALIGLENLPGDTSGYRIEQENAVTDRDMGVNPARVFGIREVSPASSTQKLFNQIGRPQWDTELQVNEPEAQNIFNEYIFPYMEYQADQLIESGRWDTLSPSAKKQALAGLIEMARIDVKEILRNTTPGSDTKKASLIYDINNMSSRGSRVFRETLRQFGVSQRDLPDLDQPQLELLLWFVKERFESNKDLIDEVLGRN